MVVLEFVKINQIRVTSHEVAVKALLRTDPLTMLEVTSLVSCDPPKFHAWIPVVFSFSRLMASISLGTSFRLLGRRNFGKLSSKLRCAAVV